MITDASIYSSVLIFLVLLPQLLYFLIRGRKSLPAELYRGRYLFYALISLASYLAMIVLVLFFSNSYGVIAQWFAWVFSVTTFAALLLVSWIIFIMNGYEIRYMFRKFGVPAHMNVIIVVIYWLTLLLSWNYWAMIPGAIFTIFSLLWSFKAYKLTKPLIDDDVPLREDDE